MAHRNFRRSPVECLLIFFTVAEQNMRTSRNLVLTNHRSYFRLLTNNLVKTFTLQRWSPEVLRRQHISRFRTRSCTSLCMVLFLYLLLILNEMTKYNNQNNQKTMVQRFRNNASNITELCISTNYVTEQNI